MSCLQLNSGTAVVLAEDARPLPAQAGPRVLLLYFSRCRLSPAFTRKMAAAGAEEKGGGATPTPLGDALVVFGGRAIAVATMLRGGGGSTLHG